MIVTIRLIGDVVEARKQKQVLLEAHREKLDELHNELAAQRQDAISTNEAIEDQKKRRRLSLALRLVMHDTNEVILIDSVHHFGEDLR